MWYEIYKFELKYQAKQPSTYLFFAVIMAFSMIAFNFIFAGQNIGQVKENAPYLTAKVMAVVTGIFMVITSMVMGIPILRDTEHNIMALFYVNPIKKSDYLTGRFLGAFTVLLFIFSGLIWGMVLGESLAWRDPENLLPFNLWHYVKPFCTIVIPTLFFGGSIFFISGALSRKMLVVYTQGLVFFFAAILSHAINQPFIASLLDPLAYLGIDKMVQYWTLAEHNSRTVPFTGFLLYNRAFWVTLGSLVLLLGARFFSFQLIKDDKKTKPQKRPEPTTADFAAQIMIPGFTPPSGLASQLFSLGATTFFYFKSILKEASFWAIVLCGVATIMINSVNIGTIYGVNSLPTTYLILEELKEMSLYFLLIILLFYPGELIWKERSLGMAGIYGALPVTDSLTLGAKLCSLLLTYVLLLLLLILSGIIFQTTQGYYQYELAVYFTGLFLEILPFLTFFTVLAFFCQVITHSKFLGHLLFIILFIAFMTLQISGLGHGLYTFGGIGLAAYSDMNGYGHFLVPFLWFKVYWGAFCMLLFIASTLLYTRGQETKLSIRWALGQQKVNRTTLAVAAAAASVLLVGGGYIFYNTNIRNSFFFPSEKVTYRANYEKTLKQYEYFPQPKIVDINLGVDLYPQRQEYSIAGNYLLVNKTNAPIREIHVQKALSEQEILEDVKFTGGASLNYEHQYFGYAIYTLNRPLQPGDTIRMTFRQRRNNDGFTESNDQTYLVENGTFFDNDRFPSLGYNNHYELEDKEDRHEQGLLARPGLPPRDDLRELSNGRSGDDGSRINFEIVISTAADQTAIAPGVLVRKWTENDRSYFHYQTQHPMINFYAMVSARYACKKAHWVDKETLDRKVALEIYHHPQHTYNLERMMHSMQRSLDYYTKYFGPYPYQQLRIMEFPRYQEFAQSFPGTIPFSEAIGFIMDIDDENDLDIPFFITAHEIAHQWWGLQVVAANVRGKNMILESLSQYAALMVMKHEYGEESVSHLLQLETEKYFLGKNSAASAEAPLAQVEDQAYIYYRKGALNLYTLQDYITEDSMNIALKRFFRNWNSVSLATQPERYATTKDLLAYLEEVTPDSLQYLLTDLLETNTIYDNKITSATYQELARNKYQLNLTIDAAKYHLDSLGAPTAIVQKEWIDIGVYTRGKDGQEQLTYLKKHALTTSNQALILIVDQLPTKVSVDPLGKLLEQKREDNVMGVVQK